MKKEKNSFLTVNKSSETKHPVGKCRFITNIAPVKDEPQAREFIARVKDKYQDATHNVYAYRVESGSSIIERISDDREPAGTGGLPVLGVIRKNELLGTAVVVTRYFGGVKLGIGGLIRAYRFAAEEGLKAVKKKKMRKKCHLEVRVNYENTGQLMKLISAYKGDIVSSEYGEGVKVLFIINHEDKEEFKSILKDNTCGEAVFLTETDD